MAEEENIFDEAPRIVQRMEKAYKAAELDIRKARTESLAFLRRYATRVGRRDAAAGRRQLLTEYKKTQKVKPGHMYLFGYDPKYKDTLPIYDKFPLIFVLEVYKGGFLGCNIHFLIPKLRQRLFELFMRNAIKSGKNDIKRLKLNYQTSVALAGNKLMGPTIKRYLWKQLETPMVEVPPSHWHHIIFLPMEQMVVK